MRNHAPSVGVGLLGLGTVGSEVAARLLAKRDSIHRRTGVDIELRRVLVRDAAKRRAVDLPGGLLTTDPADVLEDPLARLVVEVIGGEEPARTYIEAALRAGKHVVTANKMVMARHGPELLALAAEANVDVYFEAAAGGGIPLISTFKVDLQANDIERISAVINGTTNHMLCRMSSAGIDFAQALREAQEAGYAEADPTDDVGGYDARYKLAIMASIAFGARVHPDDIHREGIEGIEPVDFRYARELGHEIKLIAHAVRTERGIEARVHPAMIPLGHALAQVEGAFNAVYIEGDLVGPVLLQGQGAGGRPTASAVIGDILDLVQSMQRGVQVRSAFVFDPSIPVLPIDDVVTRAYFRMRVADRPGVLAAIGQAFAEEGVSISSAIQKEAYADAGEAEFVVTTHPARDRALQEVRSRLADLGAVRALSSFIRVL